MKIIICVDINDGMMFNNRRQSKDAKVIDNIVRYIKNKTLWVDEYSSELFAKKSINLSVDNDFFNKAKKEDYCFVEKADVSNVVIDELVVFRWDKVYPADKKMPQVYNNMILKNRLEFVGTSHDKIIREIYTNEEV